MSLSRSFVGLVVTSALILVPSAAAVAAPGDPDTSFGTMGVSSLVAGSSLNGVAVQPDRSVVATGASGSSLLVERFSSSGSPQGASTAGSGVGRAVAIQPDGKIVVAGNDGSGMLVERFNSNGSLDSSFGSGGVVHAVPTGQANAVAIGPNGTIIAAGQVRGVDGFQRVAILRLNPNGSPDTSIGAGGVHILDLGQDSIAKGVAAEGNGDIVLAGVIGPGAHQVTNAFVARTTSNGSLDPSFASNGQLVVFPQPGSAALTYNAVAIDPAGAIVVGGGTTSNTQSVAVFTRLTCSGAADHSFNGSGTQVALSSRNFVTNPYGANGVAVVAGRRIVGAGLYQDSGLAEAALWAFEPSGAADFGKIGPFGAEANALAVDPTGSLVTAGTNIPAGFLPSGYVARYQGFGGRASGGSPCGGPVTFAAPKLTNVSQSNSKWAKKKPNKSKAPVGTTFRFTLDQSASVALAFSHSAGGRKVRGKCVAQTKSNKNNSKCTRTVSNGTLTVNGKPGNNSVFFNGKVSRNNTLGTGTYTVMITATNAAGKRSSTKSLTFRIVS